MLQPSRPSRTFTISLPPELADEIDQIAARERRNRSELLREAFRQYVERRRRWDRIFTYGEAARDGLGIVGEEDITRLVEEHRHAPA